MQETILPIESIQERDVDLILLEEFCTDNTFCDWFVRELNLPKFSSSNGAWRSITDYGLGETDILFSYNSKTCLPSTSVHDSNSSTLVNVVLPNVPNE